MALVSYTAAQVKAPVAGSVNVDLQDKLFETVSVKDFGAVGDGVADDTAKIQAALDLKRVVCIPSGTYRTTAPLNVYSTASLIGEGRGASVIKPDASVLEGVQIGNVVSQIDAHKGTIEGITVDKVNYDGATENGGFVFYWAFGGSYRELDAREFKYSLWFTPGESQGVAYLNFFNCSGTGGFYNIYGNPDLGASPPGYANEITFYGGRLFTRANTDTNIHWIGGSGCRFVNVSCEGSGTQAILLGGYGNFIEMCRTEGTWSADDIVVDSGADRCLVIQHDYFSTVTDNGSNTTILSHQSGSKISVSSGGAAPPALTLTTAAAGASTVLSIISNRWSSTDYSWKADETATGGTPGWLTTQGELHGSRRLKVGQSSYAFSPLILGTYHLWINSGKLYIKNGAPSSATDGTVIGNQIASSDADLTEAGGAIGGTNDGDLPAAPTVDLSAWDGASDPTAAQATDIQDAVVDLGNMAREVAADLNDLKAKLRTAGLLAP